MDFRTDSRLYIGTLTRAKEAATQRAKTITEEILAILVAAKL
jgi:hypothetical protein